MACPHRQEMPNGIGVYCQLVDIGTPQSNPCATCIPESNGVVPTLETLTPTLEGMRKSLAGHREPPKPVRLPSMLQRMKNFAAAFAHHMATGAKTLSREKTDERLAICDPCLKRASVMGRSACSLCGCDLRTKASWAEQTCPLRLWPGDKDKPPCGKPCGS